MDEYKEFLYQRKPDRYERIDAGDVSKQLAIKKQLQCKPFKYFMEVVAPDMLEKYPPVQVEFASGSVNLEYNIQNTYNLMTRNIFDFRSKV